MNTPQQTGWITRIAMALVTVALVVLGFFFLTVALIAGALVATVFGARLWWAMRKLKRASPDGGYAGTDATATVVEGDYRVIEQESAVTRLPPKS